MPERFQETTNMQHILLLGAGRSSTALIDYLLKHAQSDNYFLTVGDLSVELALKKTGNHPSSNAIAFDINNPDQKKQEITKADIVISLLPPAMHILAARDCVLYKIPLVTASYISPEIAALHDEAVAGNTLLLNECGLDPGIDHMSAVEIIDRLKNKGAELISFKSFTGGLIAKESIDNPWGYKFTWNPRNVILAGQGTAKFIEKGKYHYIPYHRLFMQFEKMNIDGHGSFEGYANRDSLAYRKHYRLDKIPTLLRGTLRREKFCRAWNVFVQLGLTDDAYVIEDSEHLTYARLVEALLPVDTKNQSLIYRLSSLCKLTPDSEEIKMIESTGILDDVVIGLVKATPAQILQNLLEKKWMLKTGDKDQIIMYHLFEYKQGGKLFRLSSTLSVKGEDQLMTAMAKTVGYPLGIVTRLILNKRISLKGVLLPTYPEIYKPALEELNKLGIGFVEKEEEI